MAKNEAKADAVVASTEVRTGGILINPAPTTFRVELRPSAGKLTFSMYCAQRAIPVQRQAGLRAFTQTNEASLFEWDAIFKRY